MHYFGVGVHYKRDGRTESPYFQGHDKRRRPRLQYRLSAEEAVTTVESRYKEVRCIEPSYPSVSIQLDRVLAGLIDIETKWRSSVVSERC